MEIITGLCVLFAFIAYFLYKGKPKDNTELEQRITGYNKSINESKKDLEQLDKLLGQEVEDLTPEKVEEYWNGKPN